jgi:nicotinate phosphoribosyltransferase
VLKSGVPNAITVAKELKATGNDLVGVRIDSGDLAYLAVETYRAFKAAGMPGITIVLSNDLDETIIESITRQIASPEGTVSPVELQLRNDTLAHIMYGIGTKLITGGEQAALGGVYKLVAVDNEPRIKVSENVSKIIDPGVKCVYRIMDPSTNNLVADVIALNGEPAPVPGDTVYHTTESFKNYTIEQGIVVDTILEPMIIDGHRVASTSEFNLKQSQERCKQQLQLLHPTYRRLLNPHVYKVSLSSQLNALKQDLIARFK